MADKTGIEWTDATWNPVRGCSRVSAGCQNCYAETVAGRFSGAGMAYEGLIAKGGQWNGQIKLVPDALGQPLSWKKPRKIFVNSMSDLFHENVPTDFIDQVFAIMACAKQHTFQILTKRPERMRYYAKRVAESQPHDEVNMAVFDAANCLDGSFATWPLPNVWLGVSVEDQETADERIPLLLQTPAAVRWISAEPLLEAVDLKRFIASPRHYMTRCEHCSWHGSSELCGTNFDGDDIICPECCQSICGDDAPGLDWVVVGGESGKNARPMHPDWARSLRDQCKAAGVPFLFKQWGEWQPTFNGNFCWKSSRMFVEQDGCDSTGWSIDRHSSSTANMQRVGKKSAGRLLDGVPHDEYPGVQA